MTKIAIVGVEGSGKTVLMAALGAKYRLPDASGLSLKPNNFETHNYAGLRPMPRGRTGLVVM